MGNLRSVQKAFEQVGFPAEIVRRPEALATAPAVVLPGVGAFGDAMANLQEMGMVGAIRQAVQQGKPFLGICLGQQLLFESSEEFGHTAGLGLLPGQVRKFPAGELKVPHMGWNQIAIQKDCPLLRDVPDKSYFYFVHSYYVDPTESALTAALTEYGLPFASIVSRDQVFGIQFHPEKSSTMGLRILENFGKLVAGC